MAKVLKPLFSDSASGTFARTIVYRTSSVLARASGRPRPSHRASAAQLSQRADFLDGCVAWRALSQAQRDSWSAAAAPGQTGFNAFLSAFLST